MGKPKVSVLIPVYNVENYLGQCLNSVLEQTLPELEVICVDDGSTDSSSMILDEYATRDSRVQVIHMENHGYGAAMNTGLDVATGEYIGIVESDDRILPEMYETLYEKAKEDDLDLIKSDCFYDWSSLNYQRRCYGDVSGQHYNQVLLGENDREQMFRFWMYTWSGIYRRSFLLENQIRWNESPGAAFQDNGFWIQTMAFCRRAMWINEAFYLYRQDNPASSMKSRNKMMAMVEEYDFTEKILRERGLKEEVKICNYFRMQENRVTFYRISDELKTEYLKVIQEQYRRYFNEVAPINGTEETDFNLLWLNRVRKDPEGFLKDFLRRKRMIAEKLDNAKSIVFWGTGRYAGPAFERLFYNGYFPKLDAIVVSKPEPGQTFSGQTVRSPEELTADPATALVMVATGRKNFAEIEKRLKELGYWNYMDVFDFLELYWSL